MGPPNVTRFSLHAFPSSLNIITAHVQMNEGMNEGVTSEGVCMTAIIIVIVTTLK